MDWIDKLERKYRRFAIKDLIKYLVIATAFVFIANRLGGGDIVDKLYLYFPHILNGQVWRLVTFVFYPPVNDPIFIIFALYLFYMFGKSLEQYWGSFRLNVFYAIGMLSAILSAIISGNIVTSLYLNMSLFLAFAYLYPNFQLLIFFILPIKVKYLAWFDVAYVLYTIIMNKEPSHKIAAALSFVNFLVFFGKDIMDRWITPRLRTYKKQQKRKKFKVVAPEKPKAYELVLKCKECSKTSKDHPELIFAYCPRCGSDYVYCQDHLLNHVHLKN